MHLRHARQSGQVLAMDAREILAIARDDLQQVIETARHQMALQHIGNARNGGFKGLKHLIGLTGQGDFNEHRGGPPDLPRVQQGDIVADIAVGL